MLLCVTDAIFPYAPVPRSSTISGGSVKAAEVWYFQSRTGRVGEFRTGHHPLESAWGSHWMGSGGSLVGMERSMDHWIRREVTRMSRSCRSFSGCPPLGRDPLRVGAINPAVKFGGRPGQAKHTVDRSSPTEQLRRLGDVCPRPATFLVPGIENGVMHWRKVEIAPSGQESPRPDHGPCPSFCYRSG